MRYMRWCVGAARYCSSASSCRAAAATSSVPMSLGGSKKNTQMLILYGKSGQYKGLGRSPQRLGGSAQRAAQADEARAPRCVAAPRLRQHVQLVDQLVLERAQVAFTCRHPRHSLTNIFHVSELSLLHITSVVS